MSLVCRGTAAYLSLKWTKEALLMAAYGKCRGLQALEGWWQFPSDLMQRTWRARWHLNERIPGSGGLTGAVEAFRLNR